MAILDGIRKELKNLGLPEDTILDVDGEQHKLYS
jgi:hypothetical protein